MTQVRDVERNAVRDTLHIDVEYFTGFEEEDDLGHPYYAVSCREIAAFTQADTWDELLINVQEMLAAALDDEDTVATYNLVPQPKIVMTVKLPENYAQVS